MNSGPGNFKLKVYKNIKLNLVHDHVKV